MAERKCAFYNGFPLLDQRFELLYISKVRFGDLLGLFKPPCQDRIDAQGRGCAPTCENSELFMFCELHCVMWVVLSNSI